MDADELLEYLSQQEPSPWPIPFSVISRRTNIPSGCTDEHDRARHFAHVGRVIKNVKRKNKLEMSWRTKMVDMGWHCPSQRYWRMFFFGPADGLYFDPKDQIMLLRCIDHIDSRDPASIPEAALLQNCPMYIFLALRRR